MENVNKKETLEIMIYIVAAAMNEGLITKDNDKILTWTINNEKNNLSEKDEHEIFKIGFHFLEKEGTNFRYSKDGTNIFTKNIEPLLKTMKNKLMAKHEDNNKNKVNVKAKM